MLDDRIGDHAKNLLLFRLIFIHHRQAVRQLEFLMQNIGILEAGDDDSLRIDALLDRKIQEFLAVDGRHLEIHDQEGNVGIDRSKSFERVRVSLDADFFAITVPKELPHLAAESLAIIDDYDQFGNEFGHPCLS